VTLTKEERWAKAQVPKNVHCVHLGARYIGKLFEPLASEQIVLYPIADANDFIVETWIDMHKSNLSIMSWDYHNRSRLLESGEYFMLLDAISLVDAPTVLPESWEWSALRKWSDQFGIKWYWCGLYECKIWMFPSQGRLCVASRVYGK